MKTDTGIALVDLDEEGVDRAFRADVLKGLNQLPKAIPARWFYDQEGSRLFERITQLDEYYPTRAETDILKTRSNEFAQLVGQGRAVVEFGSGSSVKTPLLLEAIDPAAYVPLDISGHFLRESAVALSQKFPDLPVHPVEADFMRRVACPTASGHSRNSDSSRARPSATWFRARRSTCFARCEPRSERMKAKARCS